MEYRVIEAFVDLLDNNHLYQVGDVFPQSGTDVTLARINELASANNKCGVPLIKLADKVKKVEKKVEKKEELSLSDKVKSSGLTKSDINRMTTAELQEVAKNFGVKEAEEMSGNQIKKMLNGALED